MSAFDSRLRAARPDLAAETLRGQVTADRFVHGVRHTVTEPLLDLTATADPGGVRETQLLFGERFTAYETREDGLIWGQASRDGYVGYVAATGLGPARPEGHLITALSSHVYPRPDMKSRPTGELTLGAEVEVAGTSGDFARLRNGGFVPRGHVVPIAGDMAAHALRFAGAPYLWGGRSVRGLDCSALIQLAGLMAGIDIPRDSDMQEALIGEALPVREKLRRGDLIFWGGHVGILRDGSTLIHANAHHMSVAVEPLSEAAMRIAGAGGGRISARRRIDPATARPWR